MDGKVRNYVERSHAAFHTLLGWTDKYATKRGSVQKVYNPFLIAQMYVAVTVYTILTKLV